MSPPRPSRRRGFTLWRGAPELENCRAPGGEEVKPHCGAEGLLAARPSPKGSPKWFPPRSLAAVHVAILHIIILERFVCIARDSFPRPLTVNHKRKKKRRQDTTRGTYHAHPRAHDPSHNHIRFPRCVRFTFSPGTLLRNLKNFIISGATPLQLSLGDRARHSGRLSGTALPPAAHSLQPQL